MPEEVLFLGEDAPRVVTSMAAHLSAEQMQTAGLILAALVVVLAVFFADLVKLEDGPRR